MALNTTRIAKIHKTKKYRVRPSTSEVYEDVHLNKASLIFEICCILEIVVGIWPNPTSNNI